LALLSLQGAAGLVVPPYSDQELSGSIVDTWEVHAWWTFLVIGFCAFVTLCASVFAFWGYEYGTRRVGRLVAGLALAAAVLAYASHAVLTVRTTRLTGQTFSRAYGLF
jgi:hypothetical protein